MNQPLHRGQLRFLVFSASLRSDSLNTDLATLAALTIRAKGADVDLASMADFDCPSYNQDVQLGRGFPDVAQEFRRRLEACDGFVISSPEYNGSMPGVLKNSIDWVSRFNPNAACVVAGAADDFTRWSRSPSVVARAAAGNFPVLVLAPPAAGLWSL